MCLTLFFSSPRESCLPMPPRVYLWMEMTLETPCTPLPRTTTRISFISWSLRITERRSKVKAQGRFERHWVFLCIHIYISVYIYVWFGLKFDVGLQLEPGASRKKFYFDLLVNSLGSMVSLRKRSCRRVQPPAVVQLMSNPKKTLWNFCKITKSGKISWIWWVE